MHFVSISEFGPGTDVEVRTRYLSNWATGFEVAWVSGDRVAVRRKSDGAILPVLIATDDLRCSKPLVTRRHAARLR